MDVCFGCLFRIFAHLLLISFGLKEKRWTSKRRMLHTLCRGDQSLFMMLSPISLMIDLRPKSMIQAPDLAQLRTMGISGIILG